MLALAALCVLAGILPGFVIDAMAPVVQSLAGARMPAQASQQWLSIVPVAESRSSYNGLVVFCFIAVSASLAAYVIHRLASQAVRRAPAWDCGFPQQSPATQYTAGSFSQPIRRVFGTYVFRAKEHVEMRPPGDLRPARFEVELHDLAWELIFTPISECGFAHCHAAQPASVPDHPDLSEFCLFCSRVLVTGARAMAVILDLATQGAQMLLVLLLAPLLTGLIRKLKSRLLRRRGPAFLQPYHDLVRLIRKEAVLAENASWLFRVTPYLVFASIWVAAALVPTFATGLMFSWAADLIVVIALLGSARFFLALAGMDVGTSFGGIGSSREMMIATLAEPAMIMIVFSLALLAGSTQLSNLAGFMLSPAAGLRVTAGLALIALVMVAIAENGRIPVDNPATHLELTMVHEAMLLEYSGRHLAVIELAAWLKLLLYMSLIGCVFVPWGLAPPGASIGEQLTGVAAYVAKLAAGGFLLAAVRDDRRQDARLPYFGVSRRRADARTCLASASFRHEDLAMTGRLAFDVAHLLAGGLVLISFMLLYQNRLYALLNVFALQASVLALSVAGKPLCKARRIFIITAAIALIFKAIVIPVALHRIVARLGIHREIDTVVGIGPTMLAGIALVALSMVVMLRVTSEADALAREDLGLRPFRGAARSSDDGDARQCGQSGDRLHVARERPHSCRDGRQGHAARGRDQRCLFGPHRFHRDWDFPVPDS